MRSVDREFRGDQQGRDPDGRGGARFALDAMPGKQLAIDADVAAGSIDHEEAKRRRETEQAETTFFGSLDGASKFVKGDAIAGLLITALNLVVGLIIGLAVHDMQIGQAFETYSILTVGDGLVSQIPAVIISIASALLLARGGAKGVTDLALVDQLGRHPAALATVAGLMALFALVPGLPFVPFVLGAAALGVAAILIARRNAMADADGAEVGAKQAQHQPQPSLGDLLDIDDIHVEFAPDLIDMVLDPATGLDARIANMRNHVATTFGVLLPEIRLTDNASLPSNAYVIRIQGVEQVRDNLRPGHLLVLLPDSSSTDVTGESVREPVYGAPARWIAPDQQDSVATQGLTTVWPSEVLATHLLEVVRRNLGRLLTHKALRRLLDEMVNLSDPTRTAANRKLLDELMPDKVPPDVLLGVLRLLLDEAVSIRNLPLIIEAIAEGRQTRSTVEGLAEHVRQRLGFQLVADLRREDGTIPLVQLAPDWEDVFLSHQVNSDHGLPDVALPPDDFNRLAGAIAAKIDEVAERGTYPAVVTTMRRRRFLRTLMKAKGIPNPCLSFEEIGVEARPALVGLVAA